MISQHHKPKVSVYIPSHNYGHYLEEAIQSVIDQLYTDWELMVIDDGSSDNTLEVANAFANKFQNKIRVFSHPTPQGLQQVANRALKEAKGDYFIRLDADDYFDESALLVMTAYLDQHSEIDLVYPNYTYIDESGNYLGVENRKKVGVEAKVLDLPAHGACTLVRKRVMKSIGGYSLKYNAQDGYELWLKIMSGYHVANILTPLFFYRQHGSSLSADKPRILNARRAIKRDVAQKSEGEVKPRKIAIVPIKNTYKSLPEIAFREVAGQKLMAHTLDHLVTAANLFDEIMVTSDDPAVLEYCQAHYPAVKVVLRPEELLSPRVRFQDVVFHAITHLETQLDIYGDIFTILSIHSPLRRIEHIQAAIDTLIVYNLDSVISVYEDYDIHFAHGEYGLEPINKTMLQHLRLEREALFVDNGAIRVFWRDVLDENSMYGKKVGHMVMSYQESYQIKQEFDVSLIEFLLHSQNRE